MFVLAAVALVPLAWLIGEATQHASAHVGTGIGGFLNASFGNAPELIFSLTALAHGLPELVRASLTGSIVGNLLLVLGLALVVRTPGTIDRVSVLVSLATVFVVALVLIIPAAAAFGGSPDRRALAELSLPLAAVLLVARVVVNLRMLQRHRRLHDLAEPAPDGTWSIRVALVTLGVATLLTAVVTEVLVTSLEGFAADTHLSEFFVAAVIVAIVGNATEHASAVLVAVRGNTRLATEITLASSAQVAGFLIPVIALVSWTFEPFALSFRPIEVGAIAGAALAAGAVLAPRRASRVGGAALVAGYLVVAFSFYLAGNR